MKKHLKVIVSVAVVVALLAAMSITAFAVSGTGDGSLGTKMQNFFHGMKGERAQLTDDQKTAMKADMLERMKAKLDELVAAGTITQAQADEAYTIISESTGRVDFSKLPAEVAAALKATRPDKGNGPVNIMSQLTTEQQTAVRTVMDESIKAALAELVTAGTITQEQYDAITANPPSRETMQSLTDEQRDALRSAMEAGRTNGLAKLVENGTLTQEQADQMSQMRGGKGGHGGMGERGGMMKGGMGGMMQGAPDADDDAGTSL